MNNAVCDFAAAFSSASSSSWQEEEDKLICSLQLSWETSKNWATGKMERNNYILGQLLGI